MKSLKSQNLIHDQNYALFPEGAIINETDQNEGTPVVRGVYNDLLMNFYALLKDRGINLNNLEDNEANGYQIINALNLDFNNYSDVLEGINRCGFRNDYFNYSIIDDIVSQYVSGDITKEQFIKEVQSTKITAALDPMNSYERRFVHNLVSEYKNLTTESIGEGRDRRVTIKYKEN